MFWTTGWVDSARPSAPVAMAPPGYGNEFGAGALWPWMDVNAYVRASPLCQCRVPTRRDTGVRKGALWRVLPPTPRQRDRKVSPGLGLCRGGS